MLNYVRKLSVNLETLFIGSRQQLVYLSSFNKDEEGVVSHKEDSMENILEEPRL